MNFYSSPETICPIRKSMYKSKIQSDVQLSAGVNGKKIPAHKDVLSSVSEYFKLMFSGAFRESVESTVIVPDIKSDTLEAIIKFIYCGSVEISNPEAAFEIFESAHLMELPQLMTFSEDYLSKYMTGDVSFEVYFKAKLFDNDNLSNKAIDVIAKEFKSISQKDEFKQLDKDSLQELITELQKLIFEEDIALGILSWVNFDSNRQKYFKEFLLMLRIECVKRDEVLDELFRCCTLKEEHGIIINALMKRNCLRKNILRSHKIVAFSKVDESRYSLCEFDLTNRIRTKRAEIPHYGEVLGVWDETVLFKKCKTLTIYDIHKSSVSFSTNTDDDFNCKFSQKIGNNVYLLAKDCCYQLQLTNASLINNAPYNKKFTSEFEFIDMCTVGDKLKILVHNKSERYIKFLNNDPIKKSWILEGSRFEINHVKELVPRILVVHKNCVYNFLNDFLLIYNLDSREWKFINIEPDIRNLSIQNAASIDNKLIIFTWHGVYEYMEDQGKVRKLDDFGIGCSLNYSKLLIKS